MTPDNSLRQERRMKFTDEQLLQIQSIVMAAIEPVNSQLAAGKTRMDKLTVDLKTNNQMTVEMFAAFDLAAKGLKVLGWIGQLITKGWPVWAFLAGYVGWKGWHK